MKSLVHCLTFGFLVVMFSPLPAMAKERPRHVAPPRVLQFEADDSKRPAEITMTGRNFGTSGQVRIGETVAEVVSWRPDAITVRVPTDIAPAWHNVYLEANGASILAGQFGLPPRVALLSITEGTFGTGFSLTGNNFGDPAPRRYVVFGDWFNAVSAPVAHWTAHEVIAQVPAGVSPGKQDLWLFIDNIPSQRFGFQVIPSIQQVAVEMTDQSIYLGISGANFGMEPKSAMVTLAGLPVPVINWTQERVVVQIGSRLSPGVRELIVVANGVAASPALLRVMGDSADIHDGVWRAKYEAPEFNESW